MEKIKKWRRFALALLSLLFVGILSFALVQILPARAEDGDITVTIHINSLNASLKGSTAPEHYGTVIVTGSDDESITDKTNTLTATIPKDGKLDLTATPEEGYLFQYWTTVQTPNVIDVVSSAVSIKSNDQFSYEELKNQNITDLYANFTKKLDEADRANALLKISYDDKLGDVWLFMGSSTVTEDQIKSHGIRINPNEAFEIPYAIRQTGKTNYYYHYLTFLAVPKTEVNSSLVGSKNTSVIFNGWKASYYEYGTSEYGTVDISSVAKHENTEVPYYCETSGSRAAGVGALWRAGGSISSDYTNKGIIRLQCDPTLSGGDKYWHTSASGPYVDFDNLYIDKSSIFADFHEVAPVPTMHITPTVNGEQQGTIGRQRSPCSIANQTP